jgi:tetratricopeptide (TPR) repeat protein
MKILRTQTAVLLERLFSLERRGRYKEALDELSNVWEDTQILPDVDEFEPRIAAEFLLRRGSLIGFHGHNKQIQNSQENSKNLLSEARSRFLEFGDVEKIAECENYLALAYWRKGEINEADDWIEESFSRKLPDSSRTKLHSKIIKCLILLSSKKYEEIISNLRASEQYFLSFGDDCSKGDFYNNYALAQKNLGNTTEALNKFELARFYHQKSEHQIYLGTVENNLAQLYKLENKFARAHQAIDRATRAFRLINDRTREGFSFDTKAQIYLTEKNYVEALQTCDKSIEILKGGENFHYLAETYLTKSKALIYLDDFPKATFCLFEAVKIAETHIGEAAAKKLVKEYEETLQEKNSSVIDEIFSEKGETLELILPPSLSHYTDIQAVWIRNEHLETIGLPIDSLAVVACGAVKSGELAAIAELETDAVSCGFYDSYFGVVSLQGVDSEPQIFSEQDIRVIGKIIGVCKSERTPNGRMKVEPLNLQI